MKKTRILFAVIVFLAIVWAGLTYVVGNKAESYYLGLLEESSSYGFVAFSNISYERGFVQSRATTLMQLDLPVVATKPHTGYGEEAQADSSEVDVSTRTVQLEFEHVLYHGPLPFQRGPAGHFGSGPAIALVETTLSRFAPDQEGLESLLEEIPELKGTVSSSRIGFDGTTDSLLEVPAFAYGLDDAQLRCGGLKVESAYSLASGDLSGSYDMQSVDFGMADGGSVAWNGLAGEFDLQRALPMFYVGMSKIVVGGMVLNVPSSETGETEVVKMEEIEVVSDSSFDGKLVQLEQSASFGGVFVEGEKYGPLFIDAEMKNLDAQALSDFQQDMVDVYRDASTLDPDAIAGMLLPVYVDLFEKVLVRDPEVNLKQLSLVTPHGDAQGNFSLKLSGIEEVSLENPVMMLQYLNGVDFSADLSVDENLVRAIMLEEAKNDLSEEIAVSTLLEQGGELSDEQIDEIVLQQYRQQLEVLVAQKFIVQEAGKLKATMSFKQGELLVNGRPLPFL